MRNRLHAGLQSALPSGMLRLNGHPDERLPNTLNLSFKNLEASMLLNNISEFVAASAGAACHSDRIVISSVLQAMGVPLEWAKGALRFSVGTMTSADDIDRAVEIIARAVSTLDPTFVK